MKIFASILIMKLKKSLFVLILKTFSLTIESTRPGVYRVKPSGSEVGPAGCEVGPAGSGVDRADRGVGQATYRQPSWM